MKNYLYIAIVSTLLFSCNDVKRKPSSVYMPDMTYSQAMETYTDLDSTKYSYIAADGHRIFYNSKPVVGTVRKNDIEAYEVPNNDTTGTYFASSSILNPLTSALTGKDSSETARLFNINCGVCHGAKGDGQGPIYEKIGAVANLTLDAYKKMADGMMYHSIQYGKNNMGGYASQLNRKQRWQIVQYIRILQGGDKKVTVTTSTAVANPLTSKPVTNMAVTVDTKTDSKSAMATNTKKLNNKHF